MPTIELVKSFCNIIIAINCWLITAAITLMLVAQGQHVMLWFISRKHKWHGIDIKTLRASSKSLCLVWFHNHLAIPVSWYKSKGLQFLASAPSNSDVLIYLDLTCHGLDTLRRMSMRKFYPGWYWTLIEWSIEGLQGDACMGEERTSPYHVVKTIVEGWSCWPWSWIMGECSFSIEGWIEDGWKRGTSDQQHNGENEPTR